MASRSRERRVEAALYSYAGYLAYYKTWMINGHRFEILALNLYIDCDQVKRNNQNFTSWDVHHHIRYTPLQHLEAHVKSVV